MDKLHFKLRFSLVGHSSDVRAVAASYYPEGSVVTGSRDRTTRLWTPNENDPGFTEAHCMSGPTNFVSCICTLPPSDQHPFGFILVGSNDCSIYCFSLDSPEPIYKLLGHSGTVCALAAGKFGTIVSGSWDKTARVWLGQKCMMTLEGHQAAVWAVQVLPEQGLILTGSADKTVRMWRAGKCEKVFSGHEDCVRGLAAFSPLEFLSCSNDATIRHWRITGECLKVYYGHSNYVYSISVLPDADGFVSCGEDRTVRVWSNGECVQTLAIPAQSAWSVTCLSNGDFVVGTSDGIARVFTQNPSLQASMKELKAFEEELSKATLPEGEIGDLKINELPGKEVLFEPGTRDGQTKMVRDGTAVSAHQWSTAEGKWIKIGDVVGASGSTPSTSGKTLFEGEEYDYVFSVDIEEGKTLKLPYNVTEDPWLAAQKFIHKHELSQYYLDQISNFIITNTKGVILGETNSQVFDPFTGSSRYVPKSNGSDGRVEGSDPFTGGGRYIPTVKEQSYEKKESISGGNSVNGSGPSGNTTGTVLKAYFPQSIYLRFDTANIDGIRKKLVEFNEKIPLSQQVTASEIESVLNLVDSEENPTDQQMASLEKIIHWPQEYVFPALDILRLAVRNYPVNQRVSETAGVQMCKHLLNFVQEDEPVPNQFLALRTLCNLFCHKPGENIILHERDRILTEVLSYVNSQTKNIQIARATLLLNYSVAFHKQHDLQAKCQCLSGAAALLPTFPDNEARFRLLVTIGTLIWGDSDVIEFAKSLDLLSLIEKFRKIKEPEKIENCAETLIAVLK
ncbi:phospholipase A2 activator protein [Tachypleus tridentatus]|uniref:phospholipase A2 activator protein n=1 Tax=Tachypleus tridentatus TaxID=6853 RepID=UPI003FCFAB07